MASAARLWATWRARRGWRGTATGVTAIGTGTGRAGRPAAFLPTIAKAERGTTSTGGPGSTAGQPGRERKAGDTDPGGRREKGRKAQKGRDGRPDGIATATRRGAEGTAAESE